MNPTVFLGLVTHEGTRFKSADKPTGLIHQVSSALTERGYRTEMLISRENDFEKSGVVLTQREVVDSIKAELRIERQWRRFVNSDDTGALQDIKFTARHIYRRAKFAPLGRRRPLATERGAQMLRRLVNIELAHVKLLKAAYQSGASWAMIVEDDAQLDDVESFTSHLKTFIESQASSTTPLYLNLSDSFSYESLGLSSRLRPTGSWSPNAALLSADRPLTNTACAILYRYEFIDILLPALLQIPTSPVLPIDWKLNAALLDLYCRGDVKSDDCWFVSPGPIVQGSMHRKGGA